MIMNVRVSQQIDAITTVSHQAELVVDSEEEARECGVEFFLYLQAFNEGLGAGARGEES